jgi:DNA-binding HxlR family transcriptional regulator
MSLPRQLCHRFHRAVELVGRRWKGAIIFLLLQDRARFAQLRAAIPGITDRMLAERLHELEAEGVISRTVLPETPVRVEYALTRKGRALAGALGAIGQWAEKWIADPAPDARNAARRAPARATDARAARAVRKRSRTDRTASA